MNIGSYQRSFVAYVDGRKGEIFGTEGNEETNADTR